MGAELDIHIDQASLKYVEEQVFRNIPQTFRKKVIQDIFHVAARPLVQEARAGYSKRRINTYTPGVETTSGAMRNSIRTWDVRKGSAGAFSGAATGGISRKYTASIALGPKRDDRRAVRIWKRHYKRGEGQTGSTKRFGSVRLQVTGSYGLRHGHLGEFGQRGAKATHGRGRRVLERVGEQNAQRFGRKVTEIGGRIVKLKARRIKDQQRLGGVRGVR